MWITEYWDLTKILTISNLKVRYKSSVLGFLWSLLNPLLLQKVKHEKYREIHKEMAENDIIFKSTKEYSNNRIKDFSNLPKIRKKLKIVFISETIEMCGGNKVIMQLSNGLISKGHDVKIFYRNGNFNWFSCKAEFIKFDKPHEIPTDFDKYIATFYTTAHDLNMIKVENSRKYYFIQSYETLWVGDPMGCELTYSFPFTKFCISKWVREKTRGHHIVNPAIEKEIFFPKGKRNPKRIMYINRPDKRGNSIGLNVMKELEKLGYESLIIPWGSANSQEMAENYSSSSLYLLTSYIEGFPLPPIEAMACGCIPVVTENYGIREYGIDDNNCYIVSHQKDIIVNKILKILKGDSQKIDEMRKNCIQTARKYDWQKSVDEFERYLFEEIDTDWQRPVKEFEKSLLENMEYDWQKSVDEFERYPFEEIDTNWQKTKLLIGVLQHSSKEYCLENFVRYLAKLKIPEGCSVDCVFVDTSNKNKNNFFDKLNSIELPFPLKVIKYDAPPREPKNKKVKNGYNILRQIVLDQHYDYLWTLECDVYIYPSVLERLLKFNKYIVQISYYYQFSAKNMEIWRGCWFETLQDGIDENVHIVGISPFYRKVANRGLLEVEGIETGCTLFHRCVLEKIPWRTVKNSTNHPDVWFSLDAKKLDYSLFVDTDTYVFHDNRIWEIQETFSPPPPFSPNSLISLIKNGIWILKTKGLIESTKRTLRYLFSIVFTITDSNE